MGKKQGHLGKNGRRCAQASFHPAGSVMLAVWITPYGSKEKRVEQCSGKNLFARLSSTLFVKKKVQDRFMLH
jgi:hypothetical protein